MKQNRHSLAAKGFMVLLSLLVLVFVFTYGWFVSAETPATAYGLSLSTSTTADFEIAIGFTTPESGKYVISEFSSADNGIDFENLKVPATIQITDRLTVTNGSSDKTYNLLADFKPVDLTGNGASLVRPEMTSKNRSIDYTATTVNSDITENKQYISFDLIIRSTTSDFEIDLVDGSYVVAGCEVSTESDLKSYLAETTAQGATEHTVEVSQSKIDSTHAKLKGSSVTRKSSYGDFSEDSVVGAVRVAFTEYADISTSYTITDDNFFSDLNDQTEGSYLASSPSLLWIPRSDIYLQDDDEGKSTGWILYTSSDSEWTTNTVTPEYLTSAVTYEVAASQHYYYDRTKIANAIVNNNYSVRYTSVSAVTDLSSASSTKILEDMITVGDYTYGKCKVNLWIEGTDAEARRAIDGGSFFFGFDLSAT